MRETKPELDCILELNNALQALEDILVLENSAIQNGDINVLRQTADSKKRTGRYLQRLWASYREQFLDGLDEPQNHLENLEPQLAAVRETMKMNIRLLTAQKISSAEKISVGIGAWKRHQNRTLQPYRADGDTCDQGLPLGVALGRLI
ncbi:hypothetical protein [Magnetovibrio sp.]|uniref:hypothetical protein n=1 Tax=Magnetovibrio sp. TaxID=2024836 RepID=UPI002F92888A